MFEDVQDLIISNNMKSDENEEDIAGCSRWKFDKEKVEKSSGKQKLKNTHKSKKSSMAKFSIGEDKPVVSSLHAWLTKPNKRKVTEKGTDAKESKMRKKSKGKDFRKQQQMRQKKQELQKLLNTPLVNLDFSGFETDLLASGLLPYDVDGLSTSARPLKCTGDGNCLFYAISTLICGDEDYYASVLREETCYFLENNPSFIANHPSLKSAAKSLRRSEEVIFPQMLAMITQKSVWDKTKDKEDCIIKEAQRCRKPNTYASMVVLLGLVEVIKRPVYPNTNHNIRNIYHQKITPSNCTEDKLLYLLWSKDTDLDTKKGVAFKPNHFVPVVQ